MKAQSGDKVRVKIGAYAGQRGCIDAVEEDALVVRLEKSDKKVRLAPESITNYSLAARKAWKTEPGRRVGRRKGTRLCDRISVTLRIDRDLWERFRTLESQGHIEDRTASINAWLREKMNALEDGES